MTETLTGEDRCWPCTVVNSVVGLLVAALPLAAALLEGEPVVILAAAVWAVGVVAFTLYRLVIRGYLPGAERVAKLTGLHDRIGPDSNPERESER